jgi:Mlc titration factor MtfA (ptsG expression regulator)
MLMAFFKRRRRRQWLREPFPREWRPWIERLPFFAALTGTEQQRLREIVVVLVREKRWEGCGGLELTDEVKVTIAGQAALLILHVEHDYFRRAKTILVYPSTFVNPAERSGPGGTVVEGTATLGEAWHAGPVILAWDAARQGVANREDGHNLVLHEFAHKLDLNDHVADGTPPLESRRQYEAWTAIMTAEYERLVTAAQAGRATLLDHYGATNPAEFFAVATECFFERPRPMRQRHADLYQLLCDYYKQDPAGRSEAAQGSHTP